MAVATEAEAEKQSGDNRTMGRKNTVPYGLYVAYGFVSPALAAQTGFSEEDLDILWSALVNMFAGDRRSYSPIFQSALEKYLSYEAFRANWFGDYSYRKLPKQGKTEDHLLDSLYNERYLYGNSNGESDEEISVYTDSYVKPDNKASETSGHGKAPSLGTRSEVSAKSNFSPRVVLVAGVATLILLAAGFAVLHERSKEKGERRKA
jgi:hypothetical protein